MALLVWLRAPPASSRARGWSGTTASTATALEAAEREVRELESETRPDEGFEGDDWGPGTARPRSPVQL